MFRVRPHVSNGGLPETVWRVSLEVGMFPMTVQSLDHQGRLRGCHLQVKPVIFNGYLALTNRSLRTGSSIDNLERCCVSRLPLIYLGHLTRG